MRFAIDYTREMNVWGTNKDAKVLRTQAQFTW